MTKLYTLFFALLILTGFSRCVKFNPGDPSQVTTPVSDTILVKKILFTAKDDAGKIIDVDTTYYTYDSAKRLKTRKYINYGTLLFFEQYTYNADGTIKKVDLADRQYTKSVYLYTYKPNEIDIDKVDSTGALLDKIKFTLNAQKQPLTLDNKYAHYVYTYDNKGNVIKRQQYSLTGTIAVRDDYTYDTKKSFLANMVTNIHLNCLSEFGTRITTVNNLASWQVDGYPYNNYVYTYNSKGYPISAVFSYANGGHSTINYFY